MFFARSMLTRCSMLLVLGLVIVKAESSNLSRGFIWTTCFLIRVCARERGRECARGGGVSETRQQQQEWRERKREGSVGVNGHGCAGLSAPRGHKKWHATDGHGFQS